MKRKSLTAKERLRLFTLHGGRCHFCGVKIDGTRERWEISHEIPLELGGADDDENRLPAHYGCHREHTATKDIPMIAKAKRTHEKHVGARRPKRAFYNERFKKKVSGEVVER
jgi:5-methylcytosine-specific restriction endonuclease McrA